MAEGKSGAGSGGFDSALVLHVLHGSPIWLTRLAGLHVRAVSR